MSGAKRMLEDVETRRIGAIDIALTAKALRTCDFHGDVLLEGNGDVEYAYRVGNKKFSAGELKGIFASRRDMTDAVKAAIEDAVDECYRCAKLLND